MALNYFNRYKTLDTETRHVSPPFIKLNNKASDIFVVYEVGKSR